MASLVGDPIIRVRRLIPDPPQSVVPPICAATSTAVAGSTLTAGTYYVVETFWNAYGETLQSNEIGPLTVTSGDGIVDTVALPPTVTKVRIYLTLVNGASGSEQQYVDFPTGAISVAANPAGAQQPPTFSSAWLPDTDGSYLSAATMFDWLNDALRQGSLQMGGLIDYSGISASPNYGTMAAIGEWKRLIQGWYEGYPVSFAPPSTFFKRNIVSSTIMAGMDIAFYTGDGGLAIEVWPQPQRTPASTTVSANMAVTDTVVTLASTGNFLLPTYGMVQVGTEIMMYNAIVGSQLQGLLRGRGGTTPQAWPIGTAVNELNLFWQGRRIFNTSFVPGNGLNQLPVPAGFDGVLVHFMMSKYFATEKDSQNVTSELKEFKDSIALMLRQNRNIAGPQQVGSRDYQFITYGGTEFGRNVIP